MHWFVGRIKSQPSIGLLVATSLVLMVSFSLASNVQAEDKSNQVNLSISGSPAPSLQVDQITTTVSSMPLEVSGRVNNLTQIQVFVDGVMTAVIPLTVSDTTFQYNLNVSYGSYAVTFVGVSAYTSSNPEADLPVTYEKPVQPEPPEDSTEKPSKNHPNKNDKPVIRSGSGSSGGVNVSNDNISEDNQQADDTKPRPKPVRLPNWVISLLVPLDVINPAQVDQTPRTLWRIFVLAIGLFLLIFAHVVVALYRNVRYRQLGWAKRPAPLFLQRRPSFWVRVIGAVLTIIAFIII